MYKGQGRNQHKLMTCAYWEFLVHGEQLQSPIPSTKKFHSVPRSYQSRKHIHADLFSVARVRPRTSKGITDLLLLFNEEFLVSVSHQLALITSLPFVHTARRYYRLNGLVSLWDRQLVPATVAGR